MNHISDQQLLQHISDAVSKLTPEQTDELWNQPVTPADGSEWYLDPANEFHKKKKKKAYFISTIAACCMLCLVSVFMFQIMPSASVYLDVNPSILLKVNYRDHVTDVVAKNKDATEILKGLDLRGTDLNVALYAILGSMVHNGYLTTEQDTVLVSIHSANQKRENELEHTVSTMISDDLDRLIRSGDVLTHSIDSEEIKASESAPEQTPGKDAFIEDLIKQYPQLESYPLKTMTMDEITDLLNEKHINYSYYKNTTDHLDEDEETDKDIEEDPDEEMDKDIEEDENEDTDENTDEDTEEDEYEDEDENEDIDEDTDED